MDIINNWNHFVHKILTFYPHANLFLKGGSVIGLLLLKQIYYGKIFDNAYDDFMQMNLIKDYDFMLECSDCCEHNFYYEFGKEYGITLNGYLGNNTKIVKNKLLNVMRSPDGDLFEMAVYGKSFCIELPMTTMKIKITKDNYEYLFELIRKMYTTIILEKDLCILKYFDIDISKCENGMFDVVNLDTLNLPIPIINIIDKITNNINHKQCLCYLIKNPTNLSRLKWKNIPKSDKIKHFYNSHFNNEVMANWLLDNDIILRLVDEFIEHLGLTINDIYLKYKNEIDIITMNIKQLENEHIYYDCCYDLVGIGGVPMDIIENLKCGVTMKTFFKLTFEMLDNIKVKCEKYNVKFSNDMMDINYGKLKMDKRNEIGKFVDDLIKIYLVMFDEMFMVFDGVNLIRWRDNIHMYWGNDDAMGYMYKIFDFRVMMDLSLVKGIKFNVGKLATNSIWMLVMGMYKN
jgi:hypothetical protein